MPSTEQPLTNLDHPFLRPVASVTHGRGLPRQIDQYALGRTLGAGSMGKVKAGRDASGNPIAVKIIPRHADSTLAADKDHTARVLREITVMFLLHHPNIVSLIDALISPTQFYLVMELVPGLSLLDHVIKHGKMSDSVARSVARQLFSAVDYCHSHHIVHRDLKIENVLLSESGDSSCPLRVHLLDFGLAQLYDPAGLLTTYCGSLYFAAPELLAAHPYRGPEVDAWALGVVLFVATTGRVPFDAPSLPELHKRIRSGIVEWPADNSVSREARQVIRGLVTVDPRDRWTVKRAAAHPWASSTDASGPTQFAPPGRASRKQALFDMYNLPASSPPIRTRLDLISTLGPWHMDATVLLQQLTRLSLDQLYQHIGDPAHHLHSMHILVYEWLERAVQEAACSLSSRCPPPTLEQQQQQQQQRRIHRTSVALIQGREAARRLSAAGQSDFAFNNLNINNADQDDDTSQRDLTCSNALASESGATVSRCDSLPTAAVTRSDSALVQSLPRPLLHAHGSSSLFTLEPLPPHPPVPDRYMTHTRTYSASSATSLPAISTLSVEGYGTFSTSNASDTACVATVQPTLASSSGRTRPPGPPGLLLLPDSPSPTRRTRQGAVSPTRIRASQVYGTTPLLEPHLQPLSPHFCPSSDSNSPSSTEALLVWTAPSDYHDAGEIVLVLPGGDAYGDPDIEIGVTSTAPRRPATKALALLGIDNDGTDTRYPGACAGGSDMSRLKKSKDPRRKKVSWWRKPFLPETATSNTSSSSTTTVHAGTATYLASAAASAATARQILETGPQVPAAGAMSKLADIAHGMHLGVSDASPTVLHITHHASVVGAGLGHRPDVVVRASIEKSGSGRIEFRRISGDVDSFQLIVASLVREWDRVASVAAASWQLCM
ncbi:kinase-like domain-containing protein [Blastocladiella britannica]|nr:kinase-like domain-containing protein [Blastocladiella britannica]